MTRAMPKTSAGILPYRYRDGRVEVLLVHPGGPFWARKDDGAWSIAKGEHDAGEAPLAAAQREFAEETGHRPRGPFVALAPLKQPGGKTIAAWITEDDWDTTTFVSSTFTLEWPRGSGRMSSFPEVDRVAWFDLETAARKLLRGQRPFLDALARLVPPPAASP
ncbi:MAG: NUDIX domain-containing protein [Burkholderiales bacterium]